MIFQLCEFLEIKMIFQVVPQHNKEILHHSMILQKQILVSNKIKDLAYEHMHDLDI